MKVKKNLSCVRTPCMEHPVTPQGCKSLPAVKDAYSLTVVGISAIRKQNSRKLMTEGIRIELPWDPGVLGMAEIILASNHKEGCMRSVKFPGKICRAMRGDQP